MLPPAMAYAHGHETAASLSLSLPGLDHGFHHENAWTEKRQGWTHCCQRRTQSQAVRRSAAAAGAGLRRQVNRRVGLGGEKERLDGGVRFPTAALPEATGIGRRRDNPSQAPVPV